MMQPHTCTIKVEMFAGINVGIMKHVHVHRNLSLLQSVILVLQIVFCLVSCELKFVILLNPQNYQNNFHSKSFLLL